MPRTHTFFERLGEQTHRTIFSAVFFALRLALGVQLLLSGISKLSGWSAENFLQTASGPLAGFFQSIAGNPIVDFLNVWGQIAIGLALILGLMVRPASFFGAIMMLCYFFAGFAKNTANGPIDFHIVYMLIFILFAAGGAGHVLGLDAVVLAQVRRRKRLAKLLFG